ncbi:prolyl 4-hydroxylase subunit alpha-1-like [Ciona intestinalis]
MGSFVLRNLFLFNFILICTKAEWFSSLGQMEDLVYDELDLITSLKEYIKAEEAKLDNIKKIAERFQHISENARSNMDKYLGHPVNQYRLVRRLATEWADMEDIINENVAEVFLANLTQKQSHFPGEEDVKGTAEAIMRLQDTYRLDTHDVARGIIKGLQSNQSLTADDCFHIGRTAYLERDFYHCRLWMNEVLNQQEKGLTYSRFDVLDHFSYCTAQGGNIQKAYEITKEMLQIDPSVDRIRGNHEHYRQLLGERKRGDDGDVDEFQQSKRQTEYPSTPERVDYERLCRGEGIHIPPSVERKLKCYLYTNNGHPRLLLQPVKLEELWHSPHLVRFHGIMSDKEIAMIKSLAKPRLRRATVQNPVTGVLEFAHYRVSKSAWLKDEDHPVIKRVCQRISDVTGLSMETAEELQIANYGVGGQYEPHFDYSRKSDFGKFDDEVGNRIATFLTYMSDVEQGGSTVFLHPGIAVRPMKGSAVFWYNLLPSGAGDERTRHAACPVLTGVKWVSNKWIHERDQEFRRTCKTNIKADNRIF